MEKINAIQSDSLRALAAHLVANNTPITYLGQAWSGQTADWIYFDTVLDLVTFRTQFYFGEHIEIHQNLDPRSGTESGFVDKMTGEGVMGKWSK